eukprot:3060951-Amphidinium_carterae.5
MANFLAQRGVHGASAKSAGSSTDGQAVQHEVDELEVAGEELFKQLVEARDVFAGQSHTEEENQFRITLIGESRLLEQRGSGVHAFQGRVKKDTDAEHMCNDLVLQKSSRYETSAFGSDSAAVLARAWVHRMAFILKTYKNSDASTFQTALLVYEPPEDYVACLPLLSGRARMRAQQIVEIGLLSASALSAGGESDGSR